MKNSEIHIGTLIKEKIVEIGLSDAEFGRRINTTRQNAQAILKRKTVDTDLLFRISKALNFDFFKYFQTEDQQKSVDNLKERKTKILLQIELSSDQEEKVLTMIMGKEFISFLKK